MTAGGDQRSPRRTESETAVQRIRRALLDDAQDTRDAVGPAREEVPGTSGLLHRGVASVLFGERGKGKSTVALAVALSAAADGEKVLYLDRENGPALTRDRIEAMLDANPGWADPLADGRFVGRHYPDLCSGWRGEDFGEAVGGLGFTVVIYDSTREMLAQLGLDPDGERDLSRFHSVMVTPLRRRGIAVLLLDNVGHRDPNRPKGSGTKLDAAEQAYKITTVQRFSAAKSGRIGIACTRSRYGDEGRQWSMGIGGGICEPPTASTEAPDAKRAREASEHREAFRLACISALSEQSPQGRDSLIDAARGRGIKGRNDKLRECLAGFAADPASGIDKSDVDGYSLATSGPGPNLAGQPGATFVAGQPGPLARPLKGARVQWTDISPTPSDAEGTSE